MGEHPEVAEYMVASLDGANHPAVLARPGSGIVFNGQRKRWALEPTINSDGLNYDEIYQQCFIARNDLLATSNKYHKKLKQPPLDITTKHSWTEVEECVKSACDELEKCAAKDKDMSGRCGKLKKAFRGLCRNAGAGQTVANMIPNDSFNSVLCGGIKVIFLGLRQTGLYREEVYQALEDLPYIITDHAAHLKVYDHDKELHCRTAALYVAIFKLLNHILLWFMKNSFITGVQLLTDPKGFSEKLGERLAQVKVMARRFESHALKLQRQVLDESMQLHYWSTYKQEQIGRNVEAVLARTESLEERIAQLNVLDNLDSVLQHIVDAVERKHIASQAIRRIDRRQPSDVSTEDVLTQFQYDADLLRRDCEALKLPASRMSRKDIDMDRIKAIQSNYRLRAWLTVNEPSLLLLNGRAEPGHNSETSLISASIVNGLLKQYQAEEHSLKEPILTVPLAFFCGQHRDWRRDVMGSPEEAGMSLLLQLVDRLEYELAPATLQNILDTTDPEDLASICKSFEWIIKGLKRNIFVFLVMDGLRYFAQPLERREKTRELLSCLINTYRNRSAATLKFLFANPTRADFVEDLFEENELLNIPRNLRAVQGSPRLSMETMDGPSEGE